MLRSLRYDEGLVGFIIVVEFISFVVEIMLFCLLNIVGFMLCVNDDNVFFSFILLLSLCFFIGEISINFYVLLLNWGWFVVVGKKDLSKEMFSYYFCCLIKVDFCYKLARENVFW